MEVKIFKSWHLDSQVGFDHWWRTSVGSNLSGGISPQNNIYYAIFTWFNWYYYWSFLIVHSTEKLKLIKIWPKTANFLKMGHSRPLFIYFRPQLTVNKCPIIFLPMTGFEPRTSGIGSDRFTNWATQPLPIFLKYSKACFRKWNFCSEKTRFT